MQKTNVECDGQFYCSLLPPLLLLIEMLNKGLPFIYFHYYYYFEVMRVKTTHTHKKPNKNYSHNANARLLPLAIPLAA